MTSEAEPIPFDDFARRLPLIFDGLRSRGDAVVVERGGRLYRLAPEPVAGAARLAPTLADSEDIFAGYDPERVLAGLRASSGALDGVSAGELLADIHAQREQETPARRDE